ncbi:MAG: hypothetical protein R3B98_00335 [Hyphomonas sp.]
MRCVSAGRLTTPYGSKGYRYLRRETLSDLSGTSDPALAEAVALDWADAYLGAPRTRPIRNWRQIAW